MTKTARMIMQVDEKGPVVHEVGYNTYWIFEENPYGEGEDHWVGELVIEEGELHNKILALIKEHIEQREFKREPGADRWGYDERTCIVGYDEHTNIDGYEEQVNPYGQCWYGPSPKR